MTDTGPSRGIASEPAPISSQDSFRVVADHKPPSQTRAYKKTDRQNPRPRPMLAEPVKIAHFRKNRRGDTIRIVLKTYEGRNLVDVRQCCTSSDGKMVPTKKGISLSVLRLDELARAIIKALEKARELKLIEGDFMIPATNARAKVNQIATVDPLEVFLLRTWARAYLWAAGMMSLHEAVDGLQVAASESGVIAELGQDTVQNFIAQEFEAVHA